MVKVLIRDSDGLCKISSVEIRLGEPVTVYGHEFVKSETAEILGWGDLDGTADVWNHVGGAYSVLVPR